MILGVGTDISETRRIAEAWALHGDKFLERVLTIFERMEEWDEAKLTRRWAIKEAVAKAFGTGIGGVVGFQDIEVTHTEAGAPVVRVKDRHEKIHVSVSDDAGMAVAFAVVEKV